MLTKFMRYIVTGGLAAVVDVTGFYLFISASFPVFLAAAMSFFVAAVVNYNLTARFVFGADAGGRRFFAFLVGALIGLGINVSVTVALTTVVMMPPVLAKIGGIGVAFVLNFLINSYFVFARPCEGA